MKHMLGLIAACLFISACENHSYSSLVIDDSTDMANGHIRLQDRKVVLRVQNAPDATISASGDLQVGAQSVTTDADTRNLLKQYYADVQMVHADDIATDKAGDVMGDHIAQTIKTQLNNGHPDQIGKQIEAQAQPLVQAALRICQDMSTVKTAQDQISIRLAAFRPYGSIVSDKDITDCKSDVHA